MIWKKFLSPLLALSLLAGLTAPALAAETASVVRLTKTTGTVAISKSSGKSLSLLQNMRLYNGYHVTTAGESYAWINLDDAKLLKEDAESEVEVRKDGKKLEVLVCSGNVFFDVAEPLEDDESLNIRTSTMVVGIRGTSGYVQISDGQVTRISVLEGESECSVSDPVTGQLKSETIYGGETAWGVVYDQDDQSHPEDKCDIIKEKIAVEEIPGYVLTDVVRDVGLCDKIKENTGVDILEELAKTAGGDPSGRAPDGKSASPEVLGVADRREDKDEADLSGKLEVLEKERKDLEEKKPLVSPDKALEKEPAPPTPAEDDDDRDSDDRDSGGTATPEPEPDPEPPTPPDPPDPPAPPDPGPEPEPDPPTPPTPATHTIAFDANGGKWGSGAVQTPVQTNPDGTVTWPEEPARTGFSFSGWYDMPTGGSAITTGQTFSADKTIYAQWTEIPQIHTVTFNASGGTVSTATAQTGADGKLASLPTFTPSGCTSASFSGWYDAETGGTEISTDTVFAGDTVVYPHWIGWNYNAGTSTLTILGRGQMETYSTLTNRPWNSDYENAASLIVSEGVTSIAPEAFNHGGSATASKLTSVTLPSSLTSIGRFAFMYCNSLTEIELPDSVSSIGNEVFGSCSKLEKVKLPASLNSLPDYIFYNCTALKSIEIPAAVTSIGTQAFKECKALTSVTIPDGVKSIGSRAFENCSSLTSVTIPDSVTSIGDQTFCSCSNLTSVTISNSIKTIPDNFLRSCTSLASVTIPDGVTYIKAYAFSECSGLTSVTIPKSVTEIGGHAFDVPGPTTITFPGTQAEWNKIHQGADAIAAGVTVSCTG